MSRTCCQLPVGGESPGSTQSTNMAVKQSAACWEETAEELDGEKQDTGREREGGNVDMGGLLVRKKPLSRS